MKSVTKIFFAIVGFCFLCGWTVNRTNDIEKAKWLIGTWEAKTQKGSIYETWVKINENEYSGESYIIKEKDTIVFENIRLVQEKGGLFYIQTVKNQNEALPVRFESKMISETQLIFQNKLHDFPQIISYTKIGVDSLVAEISGKKNGKERKQTFPMKRMH